MDRIVIKGARQHNLKNIDLSLPRNRLIVITGVSGSGKSSLAFDTLFAEGQRRYLEALALHQRYSIQRLDAPAVDEIQGLSPAVAIDQRSVVRSPRSTVGTLTEIHDFLRLLFAHLGTLHCPACRREVHATSIPEMVREVFLSWPKGTRLFILAPLGESKEKEIPSLVRKLKRDGFARIRINGEILDLDPLPHLPRRPVYQMDVVVDRLILDPEKHRRLTDSIELSSRIGGQLVKVLSLDGEEKVFSELFRCTSCDRRFPELTPNLFSTHHPSGACPVCKGLGRVWGVDSSRSRLTRSSTNQKEEEEAEEKCRPFSPACPTIPCPDCEESGLQPIARSVLLGNLAIHQVSAMGFQQVRQWLENLDLSPSQSIIAERPRKEILSRLRTLEELGVGYLTLNRSTQTLSGGEAQRVRLTQQIGTPMSGILYVLDEPSIGLHPRDHQRLMHILLRLRDQGNTVIVVEHDRETILEADHVVDLGPGAGLLGGEVLFSGKPGDLLGQPNSLTGQYLSRTRDIPVPTRRRKPQSGHLRVIGASGHNLKKITVDFPIGCLTCVTGVSGSGKSTLVLDTLYAALARQLSGRKSPMAPLERIEGADKIQRVLLIDQLPIGKTPRSTPATYTDLFAHIRRIFSQIPEARVRGYGPSRFSFNVKGGRCEGCRGEGMQGVDMVFLPNIFVTCPLCRGSRFREETLDVKFKGKSIAEVLEMTVHEAAALFESFPSVRHKLAAMEEVGLGYLRLGQPATTLSGGEAQRVKIAAELGRQSSANTLYILDEPTTGLHLDDIQKLLHLLQRLVDLGHTVILIEHHPDVIKVADHLIDLGPEGGFEGGHVIACGTPEEVCRVESSYTAHYLRPLLVGRS